MNEPFVGAPGGAIPPGVLDPDIARHARELRGPDDLYASPLGALARSGQRFWRFIHHRHLRALNSLHYDGLAHTRQHDRFVRDHEATLPAVTMVDLDEINQRWWTEFALKEPTEKPQPDEVETNVKECTPQFFLRNIMRLEHEVGLPVPPYQIEVYFDPSEHERIETYDYVANFRPPEVDLDEAARVVAEFRTLHNQLIYDADWESIHGNNAWRNPDQEIPIFALFMPKALKRLRGRFATPEEARQEAESTRKHTRVLSDEDFIKMIRNPNLRE